MWARTATRFASTGWTAASTIAPATGRSSCTARPTSDVAFARAQGRLGRSWGCPALRDAVARDVIDLVKGGGLVFGYYPDPEWLSASKYLGDCAAG